jgi:uncharacterized membrane protein
MILRLILLLAAVLLVASWLNRTFNPRAAEMAARRKRAWHAALRQTMLTVAAILFLGITAFAAWHALRFEDSTAGLLALFSGPAALILGVLAWRASRA